MRTDEMDALTKALTERNAAFEADDLDWAKRTMEAAKGAPVDPMVAKLGFHKARYECTAVSTEKRLESQAWLAAGGFKRLTGEPVKSGEPLPT